MKQLGFTIGSEVLCEGQVCGRLAKVVVDPHTRRVTDLVVQEGRLLKRDSVVPISVVQEASLESINLLIERDQLGQLPAYQPHEYRPAPATGIEQQDIADILQWADAIEVLYPDYLPRIRGQANEAAFAESAVAIERGYTVWGDGVRVGTVDHVLVDGQTGEVRLLVVDRGPLTGGVILPVDLITEITPDTIKTNLGEQDLDTLYHFRARDAVDVMVELKARLSSVIDPESIQMDFEGGILALSGIVADVRTKRRVEAAARSVLGVLDVRNDLDTGTALQARVTQALAADPRTALAHIDVLAGVGVVTLRGQVDAAAIREAADQVAAAQSGVRTVANELLVASDEETALLRLGMLTECGVSFGQSLAQALSETATGTAFPVELVETNDDVTIRVSLPGVASQDVDVQIAGNTLTLAVVAGHSADDRRPYCRAIVLPATVDISGIEGALDKGVLSLRVPKRVSPAPTRVTIHTSQSLSKP